jgi:CMP-N,N'-diacetyllegionaminic acid synthase
MNIIAVIPARGGSKGIPLKNLKEIEGKPLVAHTIEHAQQSEVINRIIINTDHDGIATAAAKYGAEVLMRPAIMGSDSSEVDPLLIWTVNEIEKTEAVDIVVLLYPTAPLRNVASISKAINMVVNEGYDSVLSLYRDSTYLWKTHGDTAEPTNYIPAERAPRQLEGWNQWAENKALYVMKRDLLVNTGCRLGGKIGYVEMSINESIDIDEPDDLELCRAIMHQKSLKT